MVDGARPKLRGSTTTGHLRGTRLDSLPCGYNDAIKNLRMVYMIVHVYGDDWGMVCEIVIITHITGDGVLFGVILNLQMSFFGQR